MTEISYNTAITPVILILALDSDRGQFGSILGLGHPLIVDPCAL